jgi:hypothetical protein
MIHAALQRILIVEDETDIQMNLRLKPSAGS